MPKIHAPLFLLLLIPVVSARAQVRASITESRIITEKPGEAPDTVVLRAVAAGSRSRMEVSGPGAMRPPWQTIGSTTIMVSTDSSIITTHIDPIKKVYWIDDSGKTIANALKSMRFDVQAETGADNLFRSQNTTTTEHILDTVAVVPDSLFVVPASYTRTAPTPTASLRSAPVVP